MYIRLLLIIGMFFVLYGTAIASDEESSIAGFSSEDALQYGQRMYREGILPSGEPMKAVVMGDIPVDGPMFTCDDCHQRSGLGSVEGTVVTWPTNGRELYVPRRRTGSWRPPEDDAVKHEMQKTLPPNWQMEDVRPAYTDESLARLLRTGMDSAGRKLDAIMPLYLLDEGDMAVMVHYLKNLSVDLSPGVDETTIHFATVITDDVSENDRQTMLSVIQAHVEARNSQSRHQERRAVFGPFYKSEMYKAYRRLELNVWNLHGPEDTWSDQLQAYYQKEPVFALLGGMTGGSWQPIHEFSEENKIPCIFPLTELPVLSDSDWYTLYFSKGFYQEGQTAAGFLHKDMNIGKDAKIVIVSRDDRKSKALTQGFMTSWQEFKRPEPENFTLGPDQKLTGQFCEKVLSSQQPTFLLLWVGPDDIENIGTFMLNDKQVQGIFLSSKLLKRKFVAIPDELRDRVYLTYPYSLPDIEEKRMFLVQRWLELRGIPVTDPEMQAKMYFLGWMLPAALKHMRSEFFRDYFLEGFDMMNDQDYAIPVYPRLTFGPGQRYAAKGCYIVQLTAGSIPKLLRKSEWVIH